MHREDLKVERNPARAAIFAAKITSNLERQNDIIQLLCGDDKQETTGVAEGVRDLLAGMSRTTWFQVKGAGNAIIHTTAGASPGGPLADITFQIIFTLFLRELQADMQALGATAKVPFDGVAGFQVGDQHTQLEIPPATWVDDVALMITAPSASELVSKIADVASAAERRMAATGVILNFDKKKTEVLMVAKGKCSNKIRKQVLVDQGAAIEVQTSGGQHHSTWRHQAICAFGHCSAASWRTGW